MDITATWAELGPALSGGLALDWLLLKVWGSSFALLGALLVWTAPPMARAGRAAAALTALVALAFWGLEAVWAMARAEVEMGIGTTMAAMLHPAVLLPTGLVAIALLVLALAAAPNPSDDDLPRRWRRS